MSTGLEAGTGQGSGWRAWAVPWLTCPRALWGRPDLNLTPTSKVCAHDLKPRRILTWLWQAVGAALEQPQNTCPRPGMKTSMLHVDREPRPSQKEQTWLKHTQWQKQSLTPSLPPTTDGSSLKRSWRLTCHLSGHSQMFSGGILFQKAETHSGFWICPIKS